MSHIGNDAVIDAQRDALDEEEEFQNHLDQCGACPQCEAYEDSFLIQADIGKYDRYIGIMMALNNMSLQIMVVEARASGQTVEAVEARGMVEKYKAILEDLQTKHKQIIGEFNKPESLKTVQKLWLEYNSLSNQFKQSAYRSVQKDAV